jgi:hypothetical protein
MIYEMLRAQQPYIYVFIMSENCLMSVDVVYMLREQDSLAILVDRL